MAKRPYVSFPQVKERVSIPDALDELGILERFVRKDDRLTGLCPLPQHVHGPSPNHEQFKVALKNGVWVWHCFGDCQRGGDVIELVKSVTGLNNQHVRFWFAEHFGDRLAASQPNSKKGSAAADPSPVAEEVGRQNTGEAEKDTAHGKSRKDSSQAAPSSSSDLLQAAAPLKPLRFRLNLDPEVDYLQQRGLTADTVRRYGLGLCRRGVLNGYVAIPVYAYPHPANANPLAYLGRWPGEDFDEAAARPRYKWPDGFPKSQVIYGLQQAMEAPGDEPLIVVEGPFKVYHLVQSGFPTAVSIFGSALSDEQAAILTATGRPIVLMFDGDKAGQVGMRQAAGKLITRSFTRVAKLDADVEPDDLSPEAVSQLLSL